MWNLGFNQSSFWRVIYSTLFFLNVNEGVDSLIRNSLNKKIMKSMFHIFMSERAKQSRSSSAGFLSFSKPDKQGKWKKSLRPILLLYIRSFIQNVNFLWMRLTLSPFSCLFTSLNFVNKSDSYAIFLFILFSLTWSNGVAI